MMKAKAPPYQHTNQILDKAEHSLGNVINKAHSLQALDSAIRPHLPDYIEPYIRLANYREGTLVLQVTQSSLATRLRFELPTLLKRLQSACNFNIESIKLNMHVTETDSVTTAPAVREPSASAASSMQTGAQYCPDDQLKAAMLRLANTLSQSSNEESSS